MNRQELWNKLCDMETKDIQTLMSMSVVYLIKDRNKNLKEIIKDIKKIYKERGVI